MASADSLGSSGAEQPSLNMPMADSGAWPAAMNNLGIVPVGRPGRQLVAGFDPSLGIIAPIDPMMAGIRLVPPPPVPVELPVIKDIIHCKSCTLFPQNPHLPPPSTRERPPGCKTVFVGGLPENASEDIIREVFDRCGDIIAIRKSKKNFCHIRFAEEFMVDKSIYLSGYRMRIGSSTDKKDSGRIHVDFAQARDDLYEWEGRQRLLAREERHRREVPEDRLSPPSPPPIMHYSEHEAGLVADRLKDDGTFREALAVLLSWIDSGEVNRRSANHFYSMIQSANSRVRQLLSEKAQHEEEIKLAREHFKNAMLCILTQFEQIAAVFSAATRQKAWDRFSKAQRRNVDMWRKQCEELRTAHSEEIMGITRAEEMDMFDDDDDENPCKKIRLNDSGPEAQIYTLREENDSLRWQLDAYRNEVELLKQDLCKAYRMEEAHAQEHHAQEAHAQEHHAQEAHAQEHHAQEHHAQEAHAQEHHAQEAHAQEHYHHLLQQTLHSMQQQLLGLQAELKRKELELELARDQQRSLEGEMNTFRETLLNGLEASEMNSTEGCEKAVNGCMVVSCHTQERGVEASAPGRLRSEKEALLLGIISSFLHVHPFGANIEYLWSYIQRLDTKVSAAELERLMVQLPGMFKQEFSGVGATLEKRWKFCGFEGIQST